MKTFEISIPPLRKGGLSINLSVPALNWMDALQLASNELHEELGLAPDMATLPRQTSITITDVASGRRYMVTALPEPTAPDPPRSDAAEDDEPTLPGRRKPSRSRPNATLMETPVAVAGRNSTLTQVVETPPEMDVDGAMTLLGGGAEPPPGRALVQHPGLQKVDKPRRIAAMQTFQQAPAVDAQATLMDGQAISEAMLRKPAPAPIINSAALKKVRTIIRPGQGQTQDGPYFRPVAMLGGEANSLMELIDGAVNMAYDHVPCEAVQCLMYLENREELFVAAARGTFARQVTNAYVSLPDALAIERLGEATPMHFAQDPFELCYVKGGETFEMEVETALWIPAVVDDEIIAVMLVANSKHHKGFSSGELRGAEYLTDTLSKEIAGFLAASAR